MIEFFLNELTYLVLAFLLLLTIKAIVKMPKASKLFLVAMLVVSFHSIVYFTLLLVGADAIWYPDLIRTLSTTVKSGIDLAFANFLINVLMIYLVNIVCLTLALVGILRNAMWLK